MLAVAAAAAAAAIVITKMVMRLPRFTKLFKSFAISRQFNLKKECRFF